MSNNDIVGERKDGTPVTQEEIDKKLNEIREDPNPDPQKSGFFDKFRKKEKSEMSPTQSETNKPPTPQEIEQQFDPNELPEIIETRDAAQILEVITGQTVTEMIEDMVYDFSDSRGRRNIGLSFIGVRSAIHTMGRVHILDTTETETDEYIRVTVRVRDLTRDIDAIGVYQQDKTLRKRDGDIIPQKFYFVLAHNKALRNAWHHLVPTDLVKNIIEKYKASPIYKQQG